MHWTLMVLHADRLSRITSPFSAGGCGWKDRWTGSLGGLGRASGVSRNPLFGPVTQTGRNGSDRPGGWGPGQATPPSDQS